MANQLMLPTAAMLALIGAGLGVHLGNGAIAEVNPAYYDVEEPRTRFHGDLTPNAGARDWAAVHVSELRAAEAGLPVRPACVGCRTYPEEYYPVHEASLGKPQTGWAEMAETVAAEPAQAPALEPDPQAETIKIYAHFPVSAEEAQALAMADASLAVGDEEIAAE